MIFSKILWAECFSAKVIHIEPTFCLFVQVKTSERGHERDYRWINTMEDVQKSALFHPLVSSLFSDVINNQINLIEK